MLELAHLVAGEADAVEHHVAAAVGDATRDGLGEHARLLVDLLGHEVAMAFLAHGQALAIYLVAGALPRPPPQNAQGHPPGPDGADAAPPRETPPPPGRLGGAGGGGEGGTPPRPPRPARGRP